MLERIYSRIQYLGRKREFRECKRSNRRIQKRISERHRRCSVAKARRRNVPTGRTTREVYNKDAMWIVRQAI